MVVFESKNTNDPANPARESADILDVLIINTRAPLDPVIIVSADKRGRGGGGGGEGGERIDSVKLWQTHERKRNNDDDWVRPVSSLTFD